MIHSTTNQSVSTIIASALPRLNYFRWNKARNWVKLAWWIKATPAISQQPSSVWVILRHLGSTYFQRKCSRNLTNRIRSALEVKLLWRLLTCFRISGTVKSRLQTRYGSNKRWANTKVSLKMLTSMTVTSFWVIYWIVFTRISTECLRSSNSCCLIFRVQNILRLWCTGIFTCCGIVPLLQTCFRDNTGHRLNAHSASIRRSRSMFLQQFRCQFHLNSSSPTTLYL
jgi:hypothetical protein